MHTHTHTMMIHSTVYIEIYAFDCNVQYLLYNNLITVESIIVQEYETHKITNLTYQQFFTFMTENFVT